MKIGIVTTTYPRFYGDGAGLFTFGLAEKLKTLGHKVTIVAPEVYGDVPVEPLNDVIRVKFKPRFAREIAYGDGIVENLKKKPFLILGMPGFIKSIWRTVRENLSDCDVIDANFTAAGIAVAKAKLQNQPIVYTAHGSDIHLMEKFSLYRKIFLKTLSRYDAVVVVAKYLANKLAEYGFSGETYIIPNGIPERAFEYAPRWRDEPTAMFVGRLIKLKRPLVLLKAWQIVTKKIPDARLIFIGSGSLLEPARNLAKQLKIQNSVEFTGRLPAEKVWAEMSKGWLTILPSRREGFPGVLVESLATGTPFLTSQSGAGPDIAEQTGGGIIIPEPLTHNKLAEAIVSALSNRSKIQEMGAKAREKAKALYCWDVVARKKVQVYQSLSK